MSTVSTLFALLFITNSAFSRIRLEKFALHANERYTIADSDIMGLDSLIMNHVPVIVLNCGKVDNFNYSKYLTIGNGCRIAGSGVYGIAGCPDQNGDSSKSPCKNGITGTSGTRGTPVKNGVNLHIYIDQLIIMGKISIDLNGGDVGNLTITCTTCPDSRAWLSNKIVLRSYGRNENLGGAGRSTGLIGVGNS